ncbi:ectoine/hydroxyectoine ABC transporter substrate-binding protein EhuB [Luteipulveratus halotolerans]|uniref:ABC transporter substrate-binding protein n=1 Tax=Luteipulveratus halotolerans TaxID=1631356 RepID=A0A0L6CK26_9MICO|nr:ectoine/hydroxyectoine ABC transporter substrate-binding protein EhuB [Luteipulveratus halotolerans]KNX37950.1 ABC transporter substrate-binding protein [Luteipulveratus halotolerans]
MTLEISRRTLIRSAGLVAVTAPLVACSDSSDPARGGGGGATAGEDLLAKGKKQGYLRVAIANEPPYTKVEPDGTVTGAEPDIFRAVCKLLGINDIQGTVAGYDAMIPGLNANRWDAVTAGLFMKQSRCAQIDYSEPTVVSTESFGVKKGNPKKILTAADVVKNKDLKIAVIGGGFEEGILKGKKVPTSQLLPAKDGRTGIEMVKSGRADAFFLPTLSLNDLAKTDKDFEVTAPVQDVPVTGAGSGFRKGDAKFVAAYNVQLKKYKATPEFDALMKKWGFDADASRKATKAELCKAEG